MIDKRSKKVVVVAHCILNQNAKVIGLASYPGIVKDVVNILTKADVGIIQMPCPELTYLGINRWGKTKEQYDTPSFRKHCKSIASFIVDQLKEYNTRDYKICGIIGVNGSPSCGVTRTWSGKGGGRIIGLKEIPLQKTVLGKGILIEEIESQLKSNKIRTRLIGVPEPGKGDFKKAIKKIERMFDIKEKS